jgi:hypothetical protein
VFIRTAKSPSRLLHRGPGGGEAFERHTPEQQRVAGEELIGLILGEFIVEEGIRLAAMRDLADSSGIRHHSVDGHVFGCHDLPPSHPISFPACLRVDTPTPSSVYSW